MKKAILLCVVVLALLVKAQSTDPNPAAWYTPLDYKPPEKMDGYTTITDSRGNTQEVSFELEFDDDGNVTSSTLQNALADIKVNVNTAIQLIDKALCDLATTAYDIDYIKAQIKTLGENLTKVFQVDGMKFKIGGKTYNLKIAEGALKAAITTSTTVEYKDEDGLFMVPDDKTLESVKGSDGLYYLQLKNKPGNVVAGQGQIPYLTSALGLDWFSLKDKLDNLSLGIKKGYSKYGEIEDGGIQIKGWEDASPDTAYTLGEVLAGYSEYAGSLSSCQDDHIIIRSSDGTLNYAEIGSLKAGGAPVDGTSITTNETEGATDQGVASVYGWLTAPTLGIPYKTSNEVLGWFKQEDVIDNQSIGIVDGLIPGDTLGKFEVKGASKQTANNRYFGTPAKGAVSLGWYDLPNVTTNAVEGDEKTITTISSVDNIKRLGWKCLPPMAEYPSGARTLADGTIEWLPISEVPTNLFTAIDGVTIVTNREGALQLKGWDKFSNGVLGKSLDGDLTCKDFFATNGLAHSEDAKSLYFGLDGFADANNCTENLADLLSEGDSTHKVLARFALTPQDKPTLHYLSLGSLSFATRYVGTDGEDVVLGSGSRTNTVTFASAEDSNVKVGVTQDGVSGVKITIGVYYK